LKEHLYSWRVPLEIRGEPNDGDALFLLPQTNFNVQEKV